MPTYEYECQQCGQRFEKFQRMSDKPLRKCPSCGGAARRLIGMGAAVIVKGSGSRSTDYGELKGGCGRESPCCGRDTRCDKPPCDG